MNNVGIFCGHIKFLVLASCLIRIKTSLELRGTYEGFCLIQLDSRLGSLRVSVGAGSLEPLYINASHHCRVRQLGLEV